MDISSILVLIRLNEESLSKLWAAAPKAQIVIQKTKEITPEQVEAADAVVGNIPLEYLRNLKNAKLLQLLSSGVPRGYLELKQLVPGCALCSASGVYGRAISQYMLAGLMMLQKRLHLYRDDMKEGAWNPRKESGFIQGIRVLSVGMGDIGTHFGQLCSLLGAQVTGIRRRKENPPPFVDMIAGMEELDSLLPRMDVVALSLPQTPKTLGIMNRKQFERMKEGSFFINVGRGSAVDQEALLWALRSGKLAGALIDVMEPEPLPPDHPLWQEKNLVITPHISGENYSEETQNALIDLVCRNISALTEDKELTSRVDFETGYRE